MSQCRLSVTPSKISLQLYFQDEWSCTIIEISIGSNSLAHIFFSTLTTAFKDILCSFQEITTDANKSFFKPVTKKRKLSTTNAFAKIKKALEELLRENN